jgi:ActR/RegA family two-component response regulator
LLHLRRRPIAPPQVFHPDASTTALIDDWLLMRRRTWNVVPFIRPSIAESVSEAPAVLGPLGSQSELPAPEAGCQPGRQPLTVIIVQPFLPDSLLTVSALSGAGFHVTVAGGFVEARALLSSARPSLLLADIQLHDYNGLHLVLHGKGVRPDMAAVITARRPDVTLETEAARLGATFVPMPTTESELLAAVLRTILRAPGDATPILAPFDRRTGDRRTRRPVRAAEERRVADRRRPLAVLTASASTCPTPAS